MPFCACFRAGVVHTCLPQHRRPKISDNDLLFYVWRKPRVGNSVARSRAESCSNETGWLTIRMTRQLSGLRSSLATREAPTAVDFYQRLPGHATQIAAAEQAYVQAKMEGMPTWVCFLRSIVLIGERSSFLTRHALLGVCFGPCMSMWMPLLCC